MYFEFQKSSKILSWSQLIDGAFDVIKTPYTSKILHFIEILLTKFKKKISKMAPSELFWTCFLLPKNSYKTLQGNSLCLFIDNHF